MPEAWLSAIAGLQLPGMPLSDVLGKAGTEPPAQMERDVPNEKVGVTIGLTVTSNVTAGAHWPAAGVNV